MMPALCLDDFGRHANSTSIRFRRSNLRKVRPHARSHLIKARTPWKGRHLQDETVETQPNHHFPPDSITAGLWFPCHKTIYEISSSCFRKSASKGLTAHGTETNANLVAALDSSAFLPAAPEQYEGRGRGPGW